MPSRKNAIAVTARRFTAAAPSQPNARRTGALGA